MFFSYIYVFFIIFFVKVFVEGCMGIILRCDQILKYIYNAPSR